MIKVSPSYIVVLSIRATALPSTGYIGEGDAYEK